jgi:predicted nucleic acid-binding protein
VIAYVDSSVVLRVVLRQPGALREWRSIERAVASALVEVECLRTLDRLRLRLGRSDRDLAHRREVVFDLLRTFEIVEIERPVLARAALPLPSILGTLDAIHLATAALWRDSQGEELVMATHDAELARGARALGFQVVGLDPTPA